MRFRVALLVFPAFFYLFGASTYSFVSDREKSDNILFCPAFTSSEVKPLSPDVSEETNLTVLIGIITEYKWCSFGATWYERSRSRLFHQDGVIGISSKLSDES